MERPPNTGGPTAEVMAVSALGATIAEYKRALASNDFKEAMTLDEHELTLLIGSDERAHGLGSTRRHSSSRRQTMSTGIFSHIAGSDRLISKGVRPHACPAAWPRCETRRDETDSAANDLAPRRSCSCTCCERRGRRRSPARPRR